MAPIHLLHHLPINLPLAPKHIPLNYLTAFCNTNRNTIKCLKRFITVGDGKNCFVLSDKKWNFAIDIFTLNSFMDNKLQDMLKLLTKLTPLRTSHWFLFLLFTYNWNVWSETTVVLLWTDCWLLSIFGKLHLKHEMQTNQRKNHCVRLADDNIVLENYLQCNPFLSVFRAHAYAPKKIRNSFRFVHIIYWLLEELHIYGSKFSEALNEKSPKL